MNPLGTLESVNIRDVWQGEASHFTPWLARAENLERLGEALAMTLEPVGSERPVGPFFADIVCKNLKDDSTILIENQLERTDHRHLGQIFTYAAGLDAVTIIWISPQFTEEHRAAIDWLNRITLDNFSFFAVEIELWRIGNSSPAPKFNIVAKPNDWTREMRKKKPDSTSSGTGAQSNELGLQQIEFWEGLENYLTNARSPIHCQRAGARNWMWHSIGKTGFGLCSVVNSVSRTAKSGPEVRAEFVIHVDPTGERMEVVHQFEEELKRVSGEEVIFTPNSRNSSKFYVRKEADWTDPAVAKDVYAWLDQKHRAFLKVLQPRLSTI